MSAGTIISRWEWRTFGESFGAADMRFATLTAVDIHDSDEVYFLSTANNENVKVRDRLMDIKALEQVNADGLEQWRPVMKASFPLPADEVKKILVALGVPVPSFSRAEYTIEQFIAEIARPSNSLRVVNVHKKRARYRINECMSEVTDVTADGKKTRTVAIESEDAARVIATVREYGLAGFENISYPRGLKKLVGLQG